MAELKTVLAGVSGLLEMAANSIHNAEQRALALAAQIKAGNAEKEKLEQQLAEKDAKITRLNPVLVAARRVIVVAQTSDTKALDKSLGDLHILLGNSDGWEQVEPEGDADPDDGVSTGA